MSFGYSVGDGILLVQLAWKTLQGARQACGEHDELTREASSLHKVLQRLHRELANPNSPLNHADDDRHQELNELGRGCERVLNVMSSIVTKYNKLSDTERSGKKLWQKVKFGNGEMKDLAEIRLKLSAHTSAILMSLNLCSLGSQGRVEKQLNSVGGDLEGIRGKVDWIAANMTAKSGDGTVWTSYANDDRSFWRELRRELVKEGYRSSVIHRHKGLLKDYVEELGRRGVFDQVEDGDGVDADDNEQKVPESEDDGAESMEKASSDSPSDENDATTQWPDRFESQPLSPGQESIDNSPKLSIPSDGTLDLDPNPQKIPKKASLANDAKQNSAEPAFAIPVQVEEVLDEDFAPGAHPNSIVEEISGTGERNAQTYAPEIYRTPESSPVPTMEEVVELVAPPKSIANDLARGSNAEKQNQETVEPEDSQPNFILPNLKLDRDHDKPIKFKDAVGRKFTFPFRVAKSWQGIEGLIRQAFLHIEGLGTTVEDGHYDLLGPEGTIILPQIWEDLVQPDWTVQMQLWPKDPLAGGASRIRDSVQLTEPATPTLSTRKPPLHKHTSGPPTIPKFPQSRAPTRSKAQDGPNKESYPPPLPRASTFQLGGRSASCVKKSVEYASDDTDSDSSLRRSDPRYRRNYPASFSRDMRSEDGSKTRQYSSKDPYVVDLPTVLPLRENPSSRQHSSRSEAKSQTGRITVDTNLKDPYIVEPPHPPPIPLPRRKPTLQSHSSAPPVVPASDTKDKPRSPPLRPKWDDHKAYAAKYMQAARRKLELDHDFQPKPMRRAETFQAPSSSHAARHDPSSHIRRSVDSDDGTPRG